MATPRPRAPEPYGYAEAIHSMGSVAAPLLAGFSLTLVLHTLTATTSFRWPNLVLALIMAAALALIVSVQCTTVARLYAVPPPEPDGPEQARLTAAHDLWARRAQRSYNGGIVLLLAGITVALVPAAPLGELGARLVAVAVGLAGLLLAALWIGSAHPRAAWIARRFVQEPEPPRAPDDAVAERVSAGGVRG